MEANEVAGIVGKRLYTTQGCLQTKTVDSELVWIVLRNDAVVVRIASLDETANELVRSGGAKCEIKLLTSSHCRVVYFYPYTSFDDMKLEAPVKRELKAIASAVEKPLFAVIGRNKVLAYGEAKLSLEPSRPMPMMWPPLDGAIRIGFRKKPDGQYILY